MLKLPLDRTATRPVYWPVFLPLVTMARTSSPVWKPNSLGAGQVGAGEAVAGDPGPLVGAAAGGLDRQRLHAPVQQGADRTGAGGVEGVGLRDAEAGAVPLGAAAAGCLDRQAGEAQLADQAVAGGVDARRHRERLPGGGEDALQPLRIAFQEVPDVPGALALVAPLAGQAEVGEAVGSALGPGLDVLDLEREVGPCRSRRSVRPPFSSRYSRTS